MRRLEDERHHLISKLDMLERAGGQGAPRGLREGLRRWMMKKIQKKRKEKRYKLKLLLLGAFLEVKGKRLGGKSTGDLGMPTKVIMRPSSKALSLPPISPKRESKGRAPHSPKAQEPRINVLIKPASADSLPGSLSTHCPNNLVYKQTYYSFPSTVLQTSRSMNFELFAKVVPGVLISAIKLRKPSSLILYGSQCSGKIESLFGSGGLNDASFGGFDPDGPPAQYPFDWGLLPRLSLQLLNHFGKMKITALQYHRRCCFDVMNATSVTNFARVSQKEELREFAVDSAEGLLLLMRRLLFACTTQDSEFPDKHHSPLFITLLLEGGGDVTVALLPMVSSSSSRAQGGSLQAELSQFTPDVMDTFASAKSFVSLVLCVENNEKSDLDIQSTLELGVRLKPTARLAIPESVASKKEVLIERLNEVKTELQRENSSYKRSLREGEARNIIERLREMD